MNNTSLLNGTLNSTLLNNQLSVRIYSIVVPVLTFLCLVACLANVYILSAGCRIRKLLTPALVITLSLAVADIWASVVLATVLVVNSYLPVVHQIFLANHHCFSFMVEALRLGGIVTTVLHLLSISLLHYTATAAPVFYKQRVNKRFLAVVLASIWSIPSAGFLLAFVSIPGDGFRSPGCISLGPRRFDQLTFRVVVFLQIAIPLVVMCLLYARINCLLSTPTDGPLMTSRPSIFAEETITLPTQKTSIQSHAPMLKHTKKSTVDGATTTDRKMSRRIERRRRTMNTALLIIASFLFGWFPGSLLYVVTCPTCIVNFASLSVSARYTLSISVYFLFVFKGIWNPVLYALRIPEINMVVFANHHNVMGKK